ncbi:MAG: hypothetical protein QNJ31_00770 [Candidatus Caenarcaniphilales bacterium]|nr:hypothetical protein [Candidatus Caenarcaniphilales bacterium]
MRIHTFFYWVKNILGLLFFIAGIGMFLFFEPSRSNNNILKEYSNIISLSLLPLGALIIAGFSNLLRVFTGLLICTISIALFNYFVQERDTWLGQLTSTFASPIMMLCGILTMLLFDNKAKKR